MSNNDFSLAKILEQGIDVFTHLDSKLFLSFKSLLFQPGAVPLDYIQGKRKPYMKPFQLFFICNIIFFLLLSDADLFLIPAKLFFNGNQFSGLNISALVEAKAAKKGISTEMLAVLYDSKVASWSKLFVIFLCPMLAFGTLAIGFRKYKQYGKHFIFALSLLSFYILMAVIWVGLLSMLPLRMSPLVFKSGILFIYALYTFFALRKFFGFKILRALLLAIMLVAFYMALVLVYRSGISFFTLKLL